MSSSQLNESETDDLSVLSDGSNGSSSTENNASLSSCALAYVRRHGLESTIHPGPKKRKPLPDPDAPDWTGTDAEYREAARAFILDGRLHPGRSGSVQSAGGSNRVGPAGNRHRHWVFTSNNYDEALLTICRGIVGTGKATFIAFQPEIGAEGTKHLQGCISFKQTLTRSAACKALPHSSFQVMRGTSSQAVAYCSKESTRDLTAGFGFFTEGVQPVGAGTKGGGDISALVADARAGLSSRDLLEKYPVLWMRYQRSVTCAITLYQPRRSSKMPVRWYFGPTGGGKSYAFFAEYPDGFFKNGDNHWWCGYDGKSAVIIDDFRQSFSKFNIVLNLFDRYPMSVEFKGGSIQFNPSIVVVTCPQHPEDLYHRRIDEDIKQLTRRIDEIRYFANPDYPTSDAWRVHCKDLRDTQFTNTFNPPSR